MDNGFYGVERVTVARLYADARGSTDPLVLDQLLQRCSYATKTMGACERVDLATRWTAVDAQNQVAWLTLAMERKHAGDAAGARAAYLRAADAPRWHSQEFDLARVLARSAPASLPLSMRNAFLGDAVGKGYGVLPFNAFNVLGTFCKEDGEARTACARILAVLVRDSESLMGLNLAAPYAVRAHVDPNVVMSYQQQADAVQWALQRGGDIGDPINEADPDKRKRIGDALRELIALGERGRSTAILSAMGVTTSEAAARYVETLSPVVLKRRAERAAIR